MSHCHMIKSSTQAYYTNYKQLLKHLLLLALHKQNAHADPKTIYCGTTSASTEFSFSPDYFLHNHCRVLNLWRWLFSKTVIFLNHTKVLKHDAKHIQLYVTKDGIKWMKITQVTNNSFQMSPSDPHKPASNFQEESGLEQNHISIFKQCEASWF